MSKKGKRGNGRGVIAIALFQLAAAQEKIAANAERHTDQLAADLAFRQAVKAEFDAISAATEAALEADRETRKAPLERCMAVLPPTIDTGVESGPLLDLFARLVCAEPKGHYGEHRYLVREAVDGDA